jgi:hypothetical protein
MKGLNWKASSCVLSFQGFSTFSSVALKWKSECRSFLYMQSSAKLGLFEIIASFFFLFLVTCEGKKKKERVISYKTTWWVSSLSIKFGIRKCMFNSYNTKHVEMCVFFSCCKIQAWLNEGCSARELNASIILLLCTLKMQIWKQRWVCFDLYVLAPWVRNLFLCFQ